MFQSLALSSTRVSSSLQLCFRCARLRSSSTFLKSATTRRSYYDILNVKRSATSEEIREAFILKSKECHPDKDLTNKKLHGQFVLINEAYKVLHNPVKRQMYDMQTTSQYAGAAAGYTEYDSGGEDIHGYPAIQFVEKLASLKDYTSIRNEELAKQKKRYYKERQQANRQVAGVLVFIMVTGTLLQYKRLQSSYETIGERLDDQTHQLSLQYEKARQQARSNTIREQLHQMVLQNKQYKHDHPDRRKN